MPHAATERDHGDAQLAVGGIGGAELGERGESGAEGKGGGALQGGAAGDVHGEWGRRMQASAGWGEALS